MIREDRRMRYSFSMHIMRTFRAACHAAVLRLLPSAMHVSAGVLCCAHSKFNLHNTLLTAENVGKGQAPDMTMSRKLETYECMQTR